MKPAAALVLAGLAVLSALPTSPAFAQIELAEVDPPDGAHLEAPPEKVHLCFSQPARHEEIGEFLFTFRTPEGRALGMRIAFQPDGRCVDLFPGHALGSPVGEYTLEWRVTAAEGDEQGSGTLHFEVGEDGTPAPSPSPTPGATPTADGGAAAGGGDDDGGPDILLMALITAGAMGGAAVLATLLYLLRRAIGFDLHRPSGDDEGGGGH